MWLERIDRKAAELRKRQAVEERGRAYRPPAPDWFLELSRATGDPLAVHVGDCGMTGRRTRPLGRDDARRLLTTDGVPACPICRPDTSLHIVDLASPSFVAFVRRAAGPSSPAETGPARRYGGKRRAGRLPRSHTQRLRRAASC
ncbi:DUF6233 domain-containing protein [Streptomyces xylophagus]|uniref:DUF6233 domain-containing protein n=1 Tax=Streptomyces xylophagus TaxID=285514 RepID=UPI001F2685AA|nr:DUF6233 domain-containing protein [Streptomyces xylophagus]